VFTSPIAVSGESSAGAYKLARRFRVVLGIFKFLRERGILFGQRVNQFLTRGFVRRGRNLWIARGKKLFLLQFDALPGRIAQDAVETSIQ
jgi:hypothetical protein